MNVTQSRPYVPALLSRLTTVPPLSSILLSTIGLLLTFILDHRTGEAPVEHLYYLPVVFGALRFGVSGGLFTAAAAIGLYHLANPHVVASGYQKADLLQILIFVAAPLITARLAEDSRRLRQLASTDDLTGLSNLRGFEAQLAGLMRETRACAGTISMLVVDLDRLKSLNDSYGHLTGADAVRTVGRIIATMLPPGAAACRYGGDEFVIAVAGDPTGAKCLAEELVRQVRQTAPILAGRAMAVSTLSISIGIASRVLEAGEYPSQRDTQEGETLFQAADRALYVAKARGKGRTEVAA